MVGKGRNVWVSANPRSNRTHPPCPFRGDGGVEIGSYGECFDLW